MRRLAVLVFALTVTGLASAQIFDDFNRANNTNMGPNWSEVSGDWRIENNEGRANGANISMDWVGTPNSYDYYDVVASLDVFNPNPSLHYVALRTGVSATQELRIKVQQQSPYGGFNYVGFYTKANSAWPGGAGFVALPQPFDKGRITTYFKPGNTDTVYLDIDTDFNGVPEMTMSSPGVNNIAGQLGKGVGIGAYGLAGVQSAEFDNFRVVPEPTSLLLLAALAALRRR